MNTGVISMRYARALYLFALENKSDEDVYKGMLQMLVNLKEVHELRNVLANPTIPQADKVMLIGSAAGLPGNAELQKFAALVVKEKRENLLPFIAHSYVTIYRDENKILAAKITTAVPFPDSFKVEKRKQLMDITHMDVEMVTEIEPDIEGGFIFQVGSNRLDASVRNQLMRVKKQLIESNRRII